MFGVLRVVWCVNGLRVSEFTTSLVSGLLLARMSSPGPFRSGRTTTHGRERPEGVFASAVYPALLAGEADLAVRCVEEALIGVLSARGHGVTHRGTTAERRV